MERDLQSLLDEFDVSQASELLENDTISADLDRLTVRRIKSRVFAKADLKMPRQLFSPRRVASFAAAFVIVAGVLVYSNYGQIAQAASHLFSFFPGVGISEDNDVAGLTLDAQKTVKSGGTVLNITNAYTSGKTVTVCFNTTFHGFTAEQLEEENQKIKNESESEIDSIQNVWLSVDGKKYPYSNGSGGSGVGENSDTSYNIYVFDVNNQPLTKTSKLSLEYIDENTLDDFSCDFSLKPVQTYDSPNQIGTTEEHNNITLTATSTEKNGQLEVSLNPINKTGYKLVSIGSTVFTAKYFGENVFLQTDKGNKEFTSPKDYETEYNYYQNTSGFGSPFSYDFDVSDGAKKFVLNVPYVVVQSDETQNISVPIPKAGAENTNIPIKFKDGTALITSVEKVGDTGLQFTVHYQSAHENQQLVGVSFDNIGNPSNGYCSATYTPDKDGRLVTYFFAMGANVTNTLQLKADRAQYAFTDEYSLALPNNQ